MPLFPQDEEKIKENNPKATHLDISNQDIKDEDIFKMISLLEENDYITSIDISWNSVGNDGAKALAQFVKERKEKSEKNPEGKLHPLVKINLDKNALLDTDGGIALVRSPIPELILSRTSINNDVARVAIEEATQIHLDLGRFITPELLKQVKQKITLNKAKLSQAAELKLTVGQFFKKSIDKDETKENISNNSSISQSATTSESSPSSSVTNSFFNANIINPLIKRPTTSNKEVSPQQADSPTRKST